MEESNPRWSITAPMSVFWTAAIAARRIFRVAGLRCQRTALQSKDCLRQARGDFNPDPLRRRTRCCSSSLPFDQYEVREQPVAESSCCADGWGRTSSLRLSWSGGAPPVELHRHIRMFFCFLFFRVARFKEPRLFFRCPLYDLRLPKILLYYIYYILYIIYI